MAREMRCFLARAPAPCQMVPRNQLPGGPMSLSEASTIVRSATRRLPFTVPPLEGGALILLFAVWLFG